MRCRYHVNVELVALTDDDSRLLKCPIPGCRVVAINYDANRRESYWCRICRTEAVAHAGGLCGPCGAAYRLRHPDARLKAHRAGALH
jgi:hypothetical protein